MTRLGRSLNMRVRQRFDALLEGSIGLQQLEWPLADLYHLGFADALASVTDALAGAASGRKFYVDSPPRDV